MKRLNQDSQDSRIYRNESGISLIAVLMFMLAATTASVVVFRMIGSENFSSGARLKATEAYQASESGIDAVQAWLSNRALEAGALVTQYEEQKVPIKLNIDGNIVGSRGQSFNAYLIGVDSKAKPLLKLKFLVEGIGRDDSKVSQVVIFSTNGLYNVGITVTETSKMAKRVPPLFGGTSGTQGFAESAYIIGNTELTAGYKTTGDVIITGSITKMASGSKIGCPYKNPANPDPNQLVDDKDYPGYATYQANIASNPEYYGNFYLKEDLKGDASLFCGSVYVGRNVDTKGKITIWGDLYVKGNYDAGGQELIVHGNVTIDGNLNAAKIQIDGNLIMPNANSEITLKSDAIEVATRTDAKVWWAGTTCSDGEQGNLSAQRCNKIKNKNVYSAGGIPPKGADDLAYLGNQISKDKVNGNYIIPDPIITGMAANSWLSLEIPAGCDDRLRDPNAPKSWAKGTGAYEGTTYPNIINVPNVDGNDGTKGFVTALNECAKIGNLGKDESKWLVIKANWSGVHSSIKEYGLEGNFVFIVMDKPGSNDKYYPPTKQNSNVLLYLTQGAGSIEMNKIVGPKEKELTWNYFIYSKGDIDKIDGRLHLNGNIFMSSGAKLPSMTDPTILGNDDLFNALSNAGIISDNQDRCKGTGLDDGTGKCKICKEGENPRTHACIEIPKEEEDEDNPEILKDEHYIPVASRLPINVETKEISKEKVSSNNPLKPSVLVMPRVIRLASGQVTSTSELSKYYTRTPLNGASSASTATPSCPTGISFTSESSFECSVGGNDISNKFYVVIGKGGDLIGGSSSSGSNISSSSGNSNSLYCSQPTVNGTTITQPTVTCGNNTLTSGGFSYTGAPSSWTNVADGTYNISVSVPPTSQQCGGQTAFCGTVEVKSNNNNGAAACNLIDRNGANIDNLTTLTITLDEKFKAKATCNGEQERYPNFGTTDNGIMPQGGRLQNNEDAWYTPSQSTGEYTITASWTCGVFQTVTCGTVKVQKPCVTAFKFNESNLNVSATLCGPISIENTSSSKECALKCSAKKTIQCGSSWININEGDVNISKGSSLTCNIPPADNSITCKVDRCW